MAPLKRPSHPAPARFVATRRTLILAILAVALPMSGGLRGSTEDRWIDALAAGVPGPEQLRACVELQAHGTERAVPALARLLADPALAHAARNALTAIPAPAAGRALREALAAGSSPDPIGLIQSLAARRDSAAVALLSQLATAPASEPVALAAIDALGEIGGEPARTALERHLTSATLQARAAAALAREADRALAAGDGSTAARLAARLLALPLPTGTRAAALRLQLLADPAPRLSRWSEVLLGPDGLARQVALGVTPELPTAGFSDAARATLAKLAPEEQALLLEVWLQRADGPALGDVRALVAAESPALRGVALRALAALGDASAIPDLLDVAAAAGESRSLARAALTRIGGEGATAALVLALGHGSAARQIEALRALADRGDAGAFSTLLPFAETESPPLRNAALRALAALAGPDDLASLIAIVQRAGRSGRADEVAQVIGFALARHLDGRQPDFPEALANALRSGAPSVRIALLPRVAGTSHAVVRDAVRIGLGDPDPEVRSAAREALFRTMDARLLDDALALACTDPSDRGREAAARTVIRLIRSPDAPRPPERVAALRALADAALSPGHRRAVLEGLNTLPPAPAVRLALEWVTDDDVRPAVLSAVASLAPRIPDPTAATAALRRALAAAEDPEDLRALAAALEQVRERAGYLTAWRVLRFAAPGIPADQLLATPFPPESPTLDPLLPGSDAETRGGPPLAVGSDPRRPARLRGGDRTLFGVAYARTWLRAAEPRTVRLVVDSPGSLRLFLNRRLLHEHRAPTAEPAAVIELPLEAGWNELLLKFPEAATDWSFSARLETESATDAVVPWPGASDPPRIAPAPVSN